MAVTLTAYTFSLNSEIGVRLRPEGVRHLEREAAHFRQTHPQITSPYIARKPDVDGLTWFQAWMFIGSFHWLFHAGADSEPYFDLDIVIRHADLRGQP